MYTMYLKINAKFCDFALISGFASLPYISNLLTLICYLRCKEECGAF